MTLQNRYKMGDFEGEKRRFRLAKIFEGNVEVNLIRFRSKNSINCFSVLDKF